MVPLFSLLFLNFVLYQSQRHDGMTLNLMIESCSAKISYHAFKKLEDTVILKTRNAILDNIDYDLLLQCLGPKICNLVDKYYNYRVNQCVSKQVDPEDYELIKTACYKKNIVE